MGVLETNGLTRTSSWTVFRFLLIFILVCLWTYYFSSETQMSTNSWIIHAKGATFSFIPIESKIVQKEIRILNETKAVQETDLWVKVLKENIRVFFSEYITKIQQSYRSSHWRRSVKKSAFRIFTKFTRKHLC